MINLECLWHIWQLSYTIFKDFFLLSGIYNSSDVAVSFPNVVSGSGSSTPVSTSHLPQQPPGHLQQVGAVSPSAASAAPAAATTQVNPGSAVKWPVRGFVILESEFDGRGKKWNRASYRNL